MLQSRGKTKCRRQSETDGNRSVTSLVSPFLDTGARLPYGRSHIVVVYTVAVVVIQPDVVVQHVVMECRVFAPEIDAHDRRGDQVGAGDRAPVQRVEQP